MYCCTMELDAQVADWLSLGETMPLMGDVRVFQPSGYESAVLLAILKSIEQIAEGTGIIVAETGATSGTLATRVPHYLTPADVAWFFLPDMDLRNALMGSAFLADNMAVCIKDTPIIDPVYASSVDLLVVNSSYPDNIAEVATWNAAGKPDSYLILARTSEKMRQLIRLLEIPGRFMGNPARSFVARRNHPTPKPLLSIWLSFLEQTADSHVG